MAELKDFSRSSGKKITSAIKGKIISEFETPDNGMDDWIVIKFTDNSELRLRYDWIYEWTVSPSPGRN